MRLFFTAFALCFGLILQPMTDPTSAQPGKTPTFEISDCTPLTDFSDPAEEQAWRTVNDGVMGGRSSGGWQMAGDALVFAGTINTNGGGFSSVRRDLAPGALAGKMGIVLTAKPDDRSYRVTIRNGERFRGRRISYQAAIPETTPGEPTKVFIPFERFVPSVFGRIVPAPALDPDTADEIGLILSDGRDGGFSLRLSRLSACDVTAPSS